MCRIMMRIGTFFPLFCHRPTTVPTGGAGHVLTLGRNTSDKTRLTFRSPSSIGQVSAGSSTCSLLRLHGQLGAGGATVLSVGRPGTWMEETRPPPVHTPAVAVGGMALTPGQTLPTFERIRKTESGSTICDKGVGRIAHKLVMTRRQKGTVEDSKGNILFKSMMGRLPMRTKHTIVT